jgi:hypothetical protein
MRLRGSKETAYLTWIQRDAVKVLVDRLLLLQQPPQARLGLAEVIVDRVAVCLSTQCKRTFQSPI